MAENNVKNIMKENTFVRITQDALEATINLCPPLAESEYSLETVKEILEQNKVVSGILDDVILDIIDRKRYYIDIVVAKGQASFNGTDGYFEFLYKQESRTKPKILEDGSVDYSSFGDVQVVEQGAEIAKYIAPTKGENGINVKGLVLLGKNGKESRPLTGKGFTLSEDKLSYTANIKGKVEYSANKIVVTNLLVIDKEVNHVTGNVDFAGDILIKGNIVTGMTVRALGSIMVDGAVEAASLIAGKDIVLKNGMQGGQKGIAIAGGNISGKFFEQVNMRAIGNINANSILNCEVESDEEIVVSGRFGVIVGGNIKALKGITATIIGNISETKTNVFIGLVNNVYSELLELENGIKELAQGLEKIDKAIDQIVEYLKNHDTEQINQKRIQLIRTKLDNNTKLAAKIKKKDELFDLITKTTQSKITVLKSVFPGTKININGVTIKIELEQNNVTLKRKGSEIDIISNM